MASDNAIFIHVGFTNTGTTSLQRNFFSRRDDIFLAGEPYGERGGLFTAIKSAEDFKFDTDYYDNVCEDLVLSRSNKRPIVISDENLCDTPQLYLGPYVAPRDVIAARLHHFFPSAKIIFTIRDQRKYAISAYFNLKRNTAYLSSMGIPSLSTWLRAILSQDRPAFMQNLNFMEIINVYKGLFGEENICVLPLEMLTFDGVAAYLEKLCNFMGLQFSEADTSNYGEIYNRRMSKRQELVAELLQDSRFNRFYADLSQHLCAGQLDEFLDAGARATAEFEPGDEETIRQRIGFGNWLISKEFGLDLKRYGYLMAGDADFTERQLEVARQELAFRADIDRLSRASQAKELIALRQAAEVARLRVLATELMTVRQSPVWRTVERLDRIRRLLSRRPVSCGTD